MDNLLKLDKCPYPIAILLQFREKMGVLDRRHKYLVCSNREMFPPDNNTPPSTGEDPSQGMHYTNFPEWHVKIDFNRMVCGQEIPF